MKLGRRLARVLSVCAIAGQIGGCATPVIIATAGMSALQAGTAAYIDGRLQAAHVVSLGDAYAAASAALVDLKFNILSSKVREGSALIAAAEDDGRGIEVSLSRRTARVTKVSIRVGLFGDQSVSRLLLAQYEGRLPAPEERSLTKPLPVHEAPR
ncbi:MAG: DUF3568 family protein [Phycisphaerales bacterium]